MNRAYLKNIQSIDSSWRKGYYFFYKKLYPCFFRSITIKGRPEGRIQTFSKFGFIEHNSTTFYNKVYCETNSHDVENTFYRQFSFDHERKAGIKGYTFDHAIDIKGSRWDFLRLQRYIGVFPKI